jgi:hypothetical protein
MIKNIIIFIVFIATVFLINNYYKRSSLTFKDNRIILKVKEKSVLFDYNLLYSQNLSFSNINIVQSKLLSKKGNNSYFEVATTEALYEFNQQTEEVVKTIFEAKKLNSICTINGIRAIQVILKNSEIINLFVDDNDMKELKFFYGLPTKVFAQTVEKLQGLEVKLLDDGRIVQLKEPMSRWNVKHHDIDGVISSIDY